MTKKIYKHHSMKIPSKIKHIFVAFTDLLGILRCIHVPRKTFEEKLKDDQLYFGFDGSSIPGFTPIEDSDLVLVPDLKTLKPLPSQVFDDIAIVFANVFYEYPNKRFPNDPRYFAEKADAELRKHGFTKVIFSPEVEFFIFSEIKLDKWIIDVYSEYLARTLINSPELSLEKTHFYIKPKQGYMIPPPNDKTWKYRKTLTETLHEVGIQVTKTHHEVASCGQIEICFSSESILNASDNYQLFRFVAKNLAQKMGYIATFMPKPIPGDNGSGLHIHISLWKNDRNMFYDENDEYAKISQTAKYFIGGILKYAKPLTALLAPTINSYKRLIPGYEAPVYICWGRKNRSALIRIPMYAPQNEKQKRIEIRSPDPLVNPYLAFPAILITGLEGIRRKINPPPPTDHNVYQANQPAEKLPKNLEEALEHLENCKPLKQFFGSNTIEKYIELKRKEAMSYKTHISPWEYIMYLHM